MTTPPPLSFRHRLRQKVEHSAIAAYWLATLRSKLTGMLAWRHRLLHVGRAHIALSAKITGWSSCKFGWNSSIGARSWLNVNLRRGTNPAIVIGMNTFIGQDNFMTSGEIIDIGPYCLTGAHCAFIGSSHVVTDPMVAYAGTGTTGNDRIVVGANTFFGYGAMVLGHVRIGHGCIIGAGAVIRSDIPPFSVAVGNPARVVRHYDFTRDEWVAGPRPADASDSGPDEADYITLLQRRQPHMIQPLSAGATLFSDI
jgi:acetyltransferase-like isoleucine patch superfamily enzyme